MEPGDIDLLAIERGLVIAPAGCGKTQLIVNALVRHTCTKPVLVLTHTNAGLAALRVRLDRARVPSSAYRLSTIDGFAIRLVRTFPATAKITEAQLAADRPPYRDIRIAACNLLITPRIYDVLLATYARLLVDEYQDCSSWQHGIVYYLSHVLPTCVLGDQLQAIFGFGDDGLADWEKHVGAHFPLVAELTTPWRWINAGARELGEWVLDARRKLLSGQKIDLRDAPDAVQWIELDGSNGDRSKQLRAGSTKPPTPDGHVLIIGDSMRPARQQLLASQIPGAIVVESVDLRDLVSFAATLELHSPYAVRRIAEFAGSLMTATAPDDLLQRLETIRAGRSRKEISALEQAALNFSAAPSYAGVARLLAEFNKEVGVRVHRPLVLRACIRALNDCAAPGGATFRETAVRAREQNRMVGRSVPRRGVGSTLLLKGLEAEVCVIVEGHDLNAKNLYVAITRGSKRLVICSRTQILPAN
jgi:DNA helicase-2/ATP-dependent DNA helicase PcrA